MSSFTQTAPWLEAASRQLVMPRMGCSAPAVNLAISAIPLRSTPTAVTLSSRARDTRT